MWQSLRLPVGVGREIAPRRASCRLLRTCLFSPTCSPARHALTTTRPALSPAFRSSSALRLWRSLPSRPRFLGTWSILAVNCTTYALYNLAPSALEEKRQAFEWVIGKRLQAPVEAKDPVERARQWLQQFVPFQSFWHRHFHASYRGVVQSGRYETLLLANFMHMNLQHLAFNMLAVFFFGRQVEGILGIRRFLTFYLTAGVAAVAGQIFACGREQARVECVGASGAVYALLAYVTCLMPGQIVHVYFILPVPLWALMTLLLAFDIFYVTPDGGKEAHLTGAAFGVLRWAVAR